MYHLLCSDSTNSLSLQLSCSIPQKSYPLLNQMGLSGSFQNSSISSKYKDPTCLAVLCAAQILDPRPYFKEFLTHYLDIIHLRMSTLSRTCKCIFEFVWANRIFDPFFLGSHSNSVASNTSIWPSQFTDINDRASYSKHSRHYHLIFKISSAICELCKAPHVFKVG